MSEWGPLQALIGDWEGEGGLDTAYSHAQQKVIETPYLEKLSMKPFGPVGNGKQELYGLDYKTAMWRDNEDEPFHTEVGYWLWDAASGEILRAFVVPRGITVLAGGTTTADTKSFQMSAEKGSPRYAIGENAYLEGAASSTNYDVTITLNDDGSWSYSETTTLKMLKFPQPFAHTDANTLHRVQ